MAKFQIIKDLLKNKGMSMKELSEELNCPESTLHRLIKRNTTSIPMIENLADTLEVSPSIFFDTKFGDGADHYREVVLHRELDMLRAELAKQYRLVAKLQTKLDTQTEQPDEAGQDQPDNTEAEETAEG